LANRIDLAYEVINYNASAGFAHLRTDYPVGQRVLIRKLHETQGIITIDCAGHTFTRASLSSVTLNSDGDFWLVEKVSNTRWELVGGYETGENANGNYKRYANSKQECSMTLTRDFGDFVLDVGSGFKLTLSAPVNFTYPKEFKTGTIPLDNFSVSTYFLVAAGGVSNNTTSKSMYLATSDSGTVVTPGVQTVKNFAVGEWY
jgi:hypothetical protein